MSHHKILSKPKEFLDFTKNFQNRYKARRNITKLKQLYIT
jgi:hypothetical protein